jgi:hypothetical protein
LSTHQPRTGLANDPLWAFHGLPLGALLFWLAPLPLCLAGLGFGLPSLVIAVAVAGVALLVDSISILPVLIYLGAFGLPALLLLATALRGLAQGGGHLALGLPLALLGLWPVLVLLLAAFSLADQGGLEQSLRETVTLGLTHMGVEEPEGLVTQIIRLQAAAMALWLAIVLAGNAGMAQWLLRRQGLALAPATRWSNARLPRWYPALPAIAALGWLLADPANALLPLSLGLVLAVPLILQGLAVLHTRLRPARTRAPILVLVYALLLVFSLPGAIILMVLGLVDQFGRRNPPPANT